MLDWFIPPALCADPETLRRSRVTITIAWVLGAGVSVAVILRARLGTLDGYSGVALSSFAISMFLVPFFLRYTGRLRATGYVVGLVGLSTMTATAWITAGIRAPAVNGMSVVVLGMGFILGTRGAIGFGLLAIGILQGFLWILRNDYPLPPSPFPDEQALWTQHGMVTTIILVLVVGFVRIYESERLRKEEQLEQARQALEVEAERATEGERAKSAFLATMSHEIRTPLNAIINMNELLLDGTYDARHRRYLETTGAASRTLLELINSVLDHSRLGSGGLELDIAPFSWQALVHELRALFEGEARRKSLKLVVQLADDVPDTRMGDRVRIKQVITNLLYNAIKFTKVGRIGLQVTRGPQPDQVDVRVYDTGVGVPADQLEAIFQPFSQGAHRPPGHGGTGLGLSISNELLDLMDSQLQVESTVGVGTELRFRLTLPISDEQGVLGVYTTLPVGALRDVRVLVADDIETNCAVLAALLEPLGAKVEFARDGEEAVALAKERTFDVVLMDLNMPRLDGLAATRQILQVHPDLPVIGVSASTGAGQRKAGMESGMAAYLIKPIEREALYGALHRHLNLPDLVSVDTLRAERFPNRLGVSEETLADLVSQFVATLPRRIAVLEDALTRTDRDLLEREAHSIKGTAATLGLDGLAEAATSLEGALAAGDDPTVTATALHARARQLLETAEPGLELAPRPQLNEQRCRDALATLGPALATGEVTQVLAIAATARANGLATLPGGSALLDQVNRFDFVAARASLDVLLKGTHDANASGDEGS